jgi:DNA modification methylase
MKGGNDVAQWEIREMKVADLRSADYNPRVALRPGDDEYEKLKRSILELGIVDPLVWNKQTETLVGGHQRLTVLRDLGYTTVPCWIVDLSPEKERQANLALNKITGRWDEDKLRAVLEGLTPEEVAVAGFDARDLRALYEDDAAEVKEDEFDVDASLAAHTEPRVKRGDVIQLGRHRLMCGDATCQADADRLFGDRQADMVFTDPPYNVDYKGGTKDALKIMNDKMSDSSFYRFLFDSFSALFPHTRPGGAIYVCHADSEGLNFRRALLDSGYLVKQVLVWVKNSIVLGRQDYQWQHEPILYGWKPGAAHHWCGDRKQSTAIRPGDMLSVEEDKDGFVLSFNVGFECVRIRVPSFDVLAKSEGSSVWLFDKPTASREHPTMKPIGLCARAIRNSSERGEIVADLFSGSGSTLIASEQLGRTCYAMELDPRYCDVICDRWENLTGGGALWNDGASV